MFYGTNDPQRDAEVIVKAEFMQKLIPNVQTALLMWTAEENAYMLAYSIHPAYLPIMEPVHTVMEETIAERTEL